MTPIRCYGRCVAATWPNDEMRPCPDCDGIGDRLDQPFAGLPEHHQGFAGLPADFAHALRRAEGAERIVTDIGLSLIGTGYEAIPIVEAVQQLRESLYASNEQCADHQRGENAALNRIAALEAENTRLNALLDGYNELRQRFEDNR